jgi:hypothetical protein
MAKCITCGMELTRHRYQTGALEKLHAFNNRKYCPGSVKPECTIGIKRVVTTLGYQEPPRPPWEINLDRFYLAPKPEYNYD